MTATGVDIRARLAERAKLVNEALESFLPAPTGDFARLAEAMRYSVFAGGKRLRPALVIECCEVAGGGPTEALPAACAVEMIHTYSLIHDDLPAMDDDDLRRGKPSCHKAFDEATAILAGDALLALAFETAARTEPDAVAREVVATLARAAGPTCLVGGQMLDMGADGASASIEKVRAIHDHKTADLIAASCRAGALVGAGDRAGADEDVERLERYGRLLGRAFQIADDVLDVTSTPDELGKTPGKDAAARKATFPAAVGLEKARERANELALEAARALEGFDARADCLRALARFVVERKS
ncbi:MAG: polyprenyl synthetase family protein [Planctomycetota bacterium]